MTEEIEKRNRWRTFFILLILLLLCGNAWFFYNAYKSKEDRKQLEATIATADSLNHQLNAKVDSLKADLEMQRGDSAQKDSLINALQADLESRRNEISSLISSKSILTKKSDEMDNLLADAKNQIAELEGEKIVYQQKIDSLSSVIVVMQQHFDTLQVAYGNEVHKSNVLSAQKDSIQGLGEIIAASNITVTGVRTKGKGKEVDDQNAKKTERLKICFDLAQNRLSAGKKQTIYIKVIDPKQLTLYDATQGSGEFKDMDNGEQSKYTASVTIDYDGSTSKNYCFYWNQPGGYEAGDYTLKLYHNGYFIGESNFSLKKGFFQ